LFRTTKRLLRAWLINGPARTFGRLFFQPLISLELAGQRCLDTFATPNEPLPEQQITAMVKTFNRRRELAQLVKSVRRVQPDLPLIIADDSREVSHFPGTTTLVLLFNSGVSAGRNAALDQVQTPYVLAAKPAGCAPLPQAMKLSERTLTASFWRIATNFGNSPQSLL
jgi:hypothetical protein